MPWYWILVIISAIVGPFEAMHAWNKARSNIKKLLFTHGGQGNHKQQILQHQKQ